MYSTEGSVRKGKSLPFILSGGVKNDGRLVFYDVE